MKIATIEFILLGLALVLLIFGYWGLNTKSGQHHFDEMAGMIPTFLGYGLGLLLIVGWLGFRLYKYFF